MADALERGVKVVACYPRSMSAWLSNLISVPHVAFYAHDILCMPEMVRVVEDLGYPYKGVVDTGATPDNLPACDLTIIENDLDVVEAKCERMIGHPCESFVDTLRQNMDALTPRATVYHLSDMDDWISDFYEEHTGLPFDRSRYRLLKNLNVQSQAAMEVARGAPHA